MVSAAGVLQTYCVEHQREYWRNNARNNRPAPFGSISSVGDNGTTIELDAAHPSSEDERRTAIQKQIDVAKERVIAKKAATLPPPSVPTIESADMPPLTIKVSNLPVSIEEVNATIPTYEETLADKPLDFDHPDSCTTGCHDCVYRDVVSLLEKRVPGVRDIVSGLKALNGK